MLLDLCTLSVGLLYSLESLVCSADSWKCEELWTWLVVLVGLPSPCLHGYNDCYNDEDEGDDAENDQQSDECRTSNRQRVYVNTKLTIYSRPLLQINKTIKTSL